MTIHLPEPDAQGYTSYTPVADYFVPNCTVCGHVSAGFQKNSALFCPQCHAFLRLIPEEHLKTDRLKEDR